MNLRHFFLDSNCLSFIREILVRSDLSFSFIYGFEGYCFLSVHFGRIKGEVKGDGAVFVIRSKLLLSRGNHSAIRAIRIDLMKLALHRILCAGFQSCVSNSV